MKIWIILSITMDSSAKRRFLAFGSCRLQLARQLEISWADQLARHHSEFANWLRAVIDRGMTEHRGIDFCNTYRPWEEGGAARYRHLFEGEPPSTN